jgi:hypothetical protein
MNLLKFEIQGQKEPVMITDDELKKSMSIPHLNHLKNLSIQLKYSL